MALAKITRIEPANPPDFTGNYGLMYVFDVELDDGTAGQVNAKSQKKWKEGMEVEYTSQSTHHGTKLKLDMPGFSGGSNPRSGGGGNEDTTKGIIASWAVECAMGALDVSSPNYDQQVMQYARLALEARLKLKGEVVI